MSAPHRVVIIGGGFGGLNAARSLARAPVEVTLLDQRNYHLFQPLLYQVATGGLSPANIAAPLRSILKRQRNVRVLLAEATRIDPTKRSVALRDGTSVEYDTLIVAAGARHAYFGHPEWETHAPGLKTLEDATHIRRKIYLAFERAEREQDPVQVKAWLTFVLIGAGPTGVEMAGTLAEIARDTLRHEFRRVDPGSTRIVLLDAAERVLPAYPPELSAKAARTLARLGILVRTNTMVTAIEAERVHIRSGGASGTEETLHAHTILWSAGVQASPLGSQLAQSVNTPLDRSGRVIVEPDLSIPGHPEIFVLGDLAHFAHQGGQPLPGVAPVAMQEGRYVARRIAARLRGKPVADFRYRDYGFMAVIGRGAGVAKIGGFRFAGVLAWLLWLFVHLMYVVQFGNRLLILMQWAWNYITFNRSARLISAEPEKEKGET